MIPWMFPYKAFTYIIIFLQLGFERHVQYANANRNNGHIESPIASTSGVASDVSWDFSRGMEGWGSATTNEMQAEVSHMNGELVMDIEGNEPHIDSPIFAIHVREKQAVVLRYKFVGSSLSGKVRIRRGQTLENVGNRILDLGQSDLKKNSTDGKSNFSDILFPIIGDGLWRIGYAKINDYGATLTRNETINQIRLWPAILERSKNGTVSTKYSKPGSIFHIDWLRLVRGPVIHRVTGCFGDLERNSKKSTGNDDYNISPILSKINGILEHHRTVWRRHTKGLLYASTYNCIRSGGEEIILEGINFGVGTKQLGAPAHVFINGRPCKNVVHDVEFPQKKLSCVTPAIPKEEYYFTDSFVEIRNGKFPGLIDISRSLRYAKPPPVPVEIKLSNTAARSIDLSWVVGGSVTDQMTQTGFIIRWREERLKHWTNSMVVGNITSSTSTTVRGLMSNTSYVFGVASLTENQNDTSWFSNLDIYGRRNIVEGALEGKISTFAIGKTLVYDLRFVYFNANFTQQHGPTDKRSSIGPRGIMKGEGHYGLILVGDANIENCNSSSFCCDNYDVEAEMCIDSSSYTCRVTPFQYEYNEKITHSLNNSSTSLLPGSGRIVQPLHHSEAFIYENFCGPALRLTGSQQQQRGAAWYPRQLEVSEGFETSFILRMSNPSSRCKNMDDIYTKCRSRGGDGIAFVIQAEQDVAIGNAGHGLGYGGIKNSISVEFDSFYNFETIEPYENHISIQTRGWGENSPNHSFSLGSTTAIPDLTDDEIIVRVKYLPIFDASELMKSSFVASPYVSKLLFNEHDPNAISNWAVLGLGMLYVYVNNMSKPVLVVPLNLDATLKLNKGRAWVGFTAATGTHSWQAHDVLNWTFTSLRLDSDTLIKQ